MLAFVHHEARLNARQVDGSTLRATYAEKARLGQLAPAGLRWFNGPEFPDALSYLYQWFQELSRCREVPMGGIAPLMPSEILEWARGTDNRLQPYEFDAILAIDAEWRVAMSPDDTKAAEEKVSAAPVRAWPSKQPEVS